MKNWWGRNINTWPWKIIATGYVVFTPTFWVGSWKKIAFWIICLVLGFVIGKYS